MILLNWAFRCPVGCWCVDTFIIILVIIIRNITISLYISVYIHRYIDISGYCQHWLLCVIIIINWIKVGYTTSYIVSIDYQYHIELHSSQWLLQSGEPVARLGSARLGHDSPAHEVLQHRALPGALAADHRDLRQVEARVLADGGEGVLELVNQRDEFLHPPVPHGWHTGTDVAADPWVVPSSAVTWRSWSIN